MKQLAEMVINAKKPLWLFCCEENYYALTKKFARLRFLGKPRKISNANGHMSRNTLNRLGSSSFKWYRISFTQRWEKSLNSLTFGESKDSPITRP